MFPVVPWMSMVPEVGLVALILLVLVLDLALPAARRGVILPLAVGGLAALLGWTLSSAPHAGFAFDKAYIFDGVSTFFRSFFLVAAMFVLMMVREHGGLSVPMQATTGLLVLLATLGMILVASAGDLLTLFLAIELVTFSFYVMLVYMETHEVTAEAGMKYLVLGGIASSLFVFGSALLYGATGALHWDTLVTHLAVPSRPAMAQAGLWLLLAAVGFKVAIVPFHFWVPDVYQGGPTPVVAFLSVGSKAAGLAALLRLAPLIGALAGFKASWLFGVLSTLTLLYGNLGAIPQTNVKRLLGYSSIGHVGYLLMAFAAMASPAGPDSGRIGLGYYLLAYLPATIAAFFVVTVVGRALGGEDLAHFKGLAKRSPMLAGGMFLALLSLAGVPPLSGFFAKFLVISSAIQGGLLWLALAGASMVAVSLYYYLGIVKSMYVGEPPDDVKIEVSRSGRWTLAAAVTLLLLAGIVQQPFVVIASQLTAR